MIYPRIVLKKGKNLSVLRKHPWVFSGAIDLIDEELQDGDLVCVLDSKENLLGVGHFQHATIAVRMLSFENSVINSDFFFLKLQQAFVTRISLGLLSKTNSIFRICHGEGDGLPGLIIDFYGGVAVVQCHTLGMYKQLTAVKEALIKVIDKQLVAIYCKSKETLHDIDEVEDGYLHGSCTVPHAALENEIMYHIDWINGQKTGFFIDQRENRTLLGRYSTNKKVLNTFCYSGGFSLQALCKGATLVHSLDSSKRAIELTEQNLKLNSYKGTHISVIADAMEYIKNLPEDFDIIVLDPPAFAKHRDKRHQAIQGYKRLNAHAMRQIKAGGIIFTFSCSQVVDKALFTHTVIAAAIEAEREVKILEQLHQPADHPISAFHPEGEYLKGLIIQVL
ncbi:MAG: class I SAM-dependent rRNA methyltransferase [Bacteroidetes bacterium]|nr:class I SAM-dependent rRNA methyltransferase [Bacteroidota bacterium]